MASEFSSFERRCIFALMMLLGTAMGACTFVAIRSGGWTSTPMSSGVIASADAGNASLPPVALQPVAADLPAAKIEPLSPPAQALVTAAPRPASIADAAKAVASPAPRPIAAVVSPQPIDATVSERSTPSSSFTLDCKAGTIAGPATALTDSSVTPAKSAALAVATMSPTTVPTKPVAVAMAAKPQPSLVDVTAPLALHTLPLNVVHVLTSETDNSEWYELKLNTSQANSLRDALLALGSVAGADCDEADHLTPNTLPPAQGVPWWLPGELTDLDLISLKTSGVNGRRIVLALSGRTGRAFLYASEAIGFPNE